jgi:hypothetical protein
MVPKQNPHAASGAGGGFLSGVSIALDPLPNYGALVGGGGSRGKLFGVNGISHLPLASAGGFVLLCPWSKARGVGMDERERPME